MGVKVTQGAQAADWYRSAKRQVIADATQPGDLLAAAGGLDGTQPESGEPIERFYSNPPYVYDPIPKRDERLKSWRPIHGRPTGITSAGRRRKCAATHNASPTAKIATELAMIASLPTLVRN